MTYLNITLRLVPWSIWEIYHEKGTLSISLGRLDIDIHWS